MDRLQEAISEMESIAEAMPDQPDLQMQLALYYLVDRQPRKAIAAYSAVIEQSEDNFLALRSRGDAYLNIGLHAEAVADFDRAVELEPNDTSVLNNLAWVLATSPEDSVRNAPRAIELATRACEQSDYGQSHILSTLAAAYAESGDFETAVKWSQKAVDMEDPEHGEQLAKELASYHEKKPWREKQTMEENNSPPNPEPPLPSATETPDDAP